MELPLGRPSPGPHRIRARAYGIGSQEVVEQSITVQVRDVWDTTYVIANPYATAGSYRKGQLHVHSTSSFDGWESLPPGHLALEYKRRGYQFIAITDHDLISYATEIEDSGLITIPAYESTSDSGHITGLFVDHVIPPTLSAQQRLDAMPATAPASARLASSTGRSRRRARRRRAFASSTRTRTC